MSACLAEWRKGRRRFGGLAAAAVALTVLLWGSSASPRTADELAMGYSGLLYAVPMMNCVVMPLGMAFLASRLWDMEAKGDTLRLLLTLQSRSSLFLAKALAGMGQLALILAVEGVGVVWLGRAKGFTQALDVRALLLLLASTGAVCAMLFFAELFLSVRSGSQVAALGAGAIFSLSGLFSGFMPPALARLLPWSYFIQLSTVGMAWDSEARVGTFYALPYRFALLALALALTAAFAALAWREIRRKEA